MLLAEKIFREYDIRGEWGVDFDDEFAKFLGIAFATFCRKMGGWGDGRKQKIVGLGWDCRNSSPGLRDAMIEGLLSSGMDVLSCGMGPTPQLYFSVFEKKLDGGIQITASHNPGKDNGFKLMVGSNTLSGDWIRELKDMMFNSSKDDEVSRARVEQFNANAAYIDKLISVSKGHMGQKKLKVVVDGGNGVGGLVGPEVLRELGCEVIELYTEPDGTFPNHHPDPTVLKNLLDLQNKVKEEKADLGIAWDGDADRIGVVDEKGEAIFGDMLLILYGRELLKDVKSPTIIGDVKCSDLLFDDLSKKGATTVMARTGHSLIKAKLKELNAELAGEMSGHMFFEHRWYGFDDAIHASCRLVEIVSKSPKPLSEMLDDLPIRVSTPEIRMECDEERKFAIVEKVAKAFSDWEVDTTDGVRVRFEKGWGLVRASNTQPALVLRFEAETEEDLSRYESIVKKQLSGLLNLSLA